MPVSLYIHYPFCVRKCLYCDFLSEGLIQSDGLTQQPSAAEGAAVSLHQDKELCKEKEINEQHKPCGAAARRAYLHALEREIAHSGMEGADVDTIFIGGGTPSLMDPEDLDSLMDELHQHFCIRQTAEITLECNPGTVTRGKLQAFHDAGINRLSIGVQSFHDEELRLLGRIHTRAQAIQCYEDARAAGFANINLDLMSALPGQQYETWMDNLSQATQLAPEHISAYSLILEDGTPLKHQYDAGQLPPVPEDEEDRKMYHDTRTFLEAHGYHRYEISNYATQGHECAHNLGYWSGHQYLGLGLGSSSLIGNVRFHNTANMQEYLQLCPAPRPQHFDRQSPPVPAPTSEIPFTSPRLPGLVRDIEPLSQQDQMGEFMWLGLRKTAGVSEQDFYTRFHRPLMDVWGPVIEGHIHNGLLKRQNGMIYLTEYGTDISNYVMCDFV